MLVFLVLGSIVIFNAIPQSHAGFEEARIPQGIELAPVDNKSTTNMIRAGGGSSAGAPSRNLITLQAPAGLLSRTNITVSPVAPTGPGEFTGPLVNSGKLSGRGDGLSPLQGPSGIPSSRSQVVFMDIASVGERVAILVDCSDYMLEDGKGGLEAFRLVKDECVKVVESLRPGAVFNLYLFSRWQINRFRPHMVAATPRTVEELREWILPINESVQGRGINQNNFTPEKEYFSGKHHWVNWPRALHAAMEDQAESIFMIIATFPNIREEWEDLPSRDRERALREHERRKRDYDRELERWKGSREERDYNEWHATYMAPVYKKAQEIWDEEQAKRRAQGRHERIVVGSHIHTIMHEHGLKPEKNAPKGPPSYHPYWDYTLERLVERFRGELIQDWYRTHKKPDPSINIILFGSEERAAQNWQRFVREIGRSNRGQFRVIQSLAEMQAAASQSAEQRQRR